MTPFRKNVRAAILKVGNLCFEQTPPTAILCYHSIHASHSFRSVSPEMFDAHLVWLREHCEVVTLRELAAGRATSAVTRPRVAITFDDGYADNYEVAFPLLQKHQLPATFYLTVGYVDRDPAVFDRIRQLRRTTSDELTPLTWENAREMAAGGMEIGAHTYSHPQLSAITRPNLVREIRDSRSIIQDRLGLPVASFAYPFGKYRRDFTDRSVEVVREAGYSTAVSVCYRSIAPRDSELNLPRFITTGDSVAGLASKLTERGWDLVGRCQEHMPRWFARMASPTDY